MSAPDPQAFLASPYPLDPAQFELLAQAINGLSRDQLHWASGYIAGLSSATTADIQPLHLAAPETPAEDTLTILYASQTGNAQAVAQQLADSASARGITSKLVSAANFKPRDLAKEKILLLVVSTQGEGEVPESAQDLWKFLNGRKKPDLSGLQFAVYGLGDSSYTFFCKAGIDFDNRLAELGGRRLLERVDADVDFDAVTDSWVPQALEKVEQLAPGKQAVVVPISPQQQKVRYGRNAPYRATLLENRQLTTDKALADVRHLSLEIDPQAISYEPGDSLGVWFRNSPELVTDILQILQLDGKTAVTLGTEDLTLSGALSNKRELTLMNPAVINGWAAIADSEKLKEIAAEQTALREYAADRQFIDVIREFPGHVEAQQLVELLKPLQPRLYSIASSQNELDDEVHLTVSALQYQAYGHSHEGAASGFLIDRLSEDENVDVYVVENESFRLPENSETPVIMIGAGTGIAPFRSFMQERSARGDEGKNWLIFGNRNFHEDFLYQSEWIEHRNNGTLDKVNVAFSRDSKKRVYVQDKVLEQGQEIYDWIQKGAHIYVCGALDMEAGVAEALEQVAKEFGGGSDQFAENFVESLKESGRYSRDVY